jgi:hypothetical protein
VETKKHEPASPQMIETFLARGKEPEKWPDMPLFEVMGKEGDTKSIWDPNNPDEVEAARKQFDFLVGEKRYAAFAVDKDGNKGAQIRTFDPKASRIIFVPAMQGG